jgi:hypothetical protein
MSQVTAIALPMLLFAVCGCAGVPTHQSSAVPVLATTGTLVVKKIELDDRNTLLVTQEGSNVVHVEILYARERMLVQRFTSGNGTIDADDIRTVSLDAKSNDSEYVITIHVHGSNYGAMIGLVVYRLVWWEFFIIPDDVFSIGDIDEDGALEIWCGRLQGKTFAFARGLLKEKPPANKDVEPPR